jgi:hypothetical protein
MLLPHKEHEKVLKRVKLNFLKKLFMAPNDINIYNVHRFFYELGLLSI